MSFNRFLMYAGWLVVGVGGLTAGGSTIVLLRGDPTYLVQARTRGGAPYGAPAPVAFPWRAFSATILIGAFVLAARRAFSDATADLRLPVLLGFGLWLIDVAVFAGTRPLFPAALLITWLTLPLLLIAYAETISELASQRGPAPSWAFWGLGLVLLALPIGWAIFFSAAE